MQRFRVFLESERGEFGSFVDSKPGTSSPKPVVVIEIGSLAGGLVFSL